METNTTGTAGEVGGAATHPETAYRIARTIAASMPMGVALFYAVILYLDRGGDGTGGGGPFGGSVAVTLCVLFAVAMLAAALLVRSRAVHAADEAQRSGGASEVARRAALVQSRLIVAWALLEAPALLAGVMVFLGADQRLLWYVGPLYALGMVLTFPRAEWFGVDPRAT